MEKLHDESTAREHPLLRLLLIFLWWILLALEAVGSVVAFVIFTVLMLSWLLYRATAQGAYTCAAAWRRSRRQGLVARIFIHADNAVLMAQIGTEVLTFFVRRKLPTLLAESTKAALDRRPWILKAVEYMKVAFALSLLLLLIPFMIFDALRMLRLSPEDRALENWRTHRSMP